jgi:hypothetical protein
MQWIWLMRVAAERRSSVTRFLAQRYTLSVPKDIVGIEICLNLFQPGKVFAPISGRVVGQIQIAVIYIGATGHIGRSDA